MTRLKKNLTKSLFPYLLHLTNISNNQSLIQNIDPISFFAVYILSFWDTKKADVSVTHTKVKEQNMSFPPLHPAPSY